MHLAMPPLFVGVLSLEVPSIVVSTPNAVPRLVKVFGQAFWILIMI